MLKIMHVFEEIRYLYRGTLRIFLILLHDFPNFLCNFSFELCDSIPINCIQMRNLILSAFPQNMRLPDPFTPTLQLSSLPESKLDPLGEEDTEALLAQIIP